MSFRRWGLASVVVVSAACAWVPSGVARAQEAQAAQTSAEVAAPPADDARGLFLRGQTAYSQGDYEDAASLWERAYALEARIGLQYNLSQAYERLGRLTDAANALEAYVNGTSTDDERLPDARARLAAIRERIGRTGVLLDGGPEGAVLLVDGEDRGRLPRRDPLMVSPGSHEIRVRAGGYHDFAASVAVPAGQTVNVGIEMLPVSSGPSLGPILTMAGGGVVLITGLVLGGVALDQAGHAMSRTGSDADSARTLALVSDILWPVGTAAIAGGLVWLVLDMNSQTASEASTTSLEIVPLVGPGLFGASTAGRF
ncbi:MAG: PEGA domain-containing protein [Sandaracinaceae bacterium]|nr:PEGA domain-containing protein [Sandaracinaceae bacterium]